jgi:hypothetical protein
MSQNKNRLTKEEAIRQVKEVLEMGEEGQTNRDRQTRELIRQKMAEAQTKLQQGKQIG